MALIYQKVVQVRGQYPRFQVIQQIYNVMAIINQLITIFQRKFFKNLGNQESEKKNFLYHKNSHFILSPTKKLGKL